MQQEEKVNEKVSSTKKDLLNTLREISSLFDKEDSFKSVKIHAWENKGYHKSSRRGADK